MGREANSVVKLETTELYCGCNKATLPDSHTEHTHTVLVFPWYSKVNILTLPVKATTIILPIPRGEVAH